MAEKSKKTKSNPKNPVMEEPLPTNPEAEREILGAFLNGHPDCDELLESVVSDDFFSRSNQLIWGAILGLKKNQQPISFTSIIDYLRADGDLEKAGGEVMVANCADMLITTPGSTRFAAEDIRDKRIKRWLIYHYEDLIQQLRSNNRASQVIDIDLEALARLASSVNAPHVVSPWDASLKLMESLEAKNEPRIFTGIRELDEKAGGFRPGELVIYTAETGTGKTLLAQQTRRRACAAGWHGLYCSGEMFAHSLMARELSAQAKVPHKKMRHPESIDMYEYGELMNAAALQCKKCAILDGDLSLTGIKAAARKMKKAGNLSLIVIDYDELVETPGEDEWDEQRTLVRQGKSLGMELNCAVILISQLRKTLNDAEKQSPSLSRLYGSGAKTKHAHSVIYVQREFTDLPSADGKYPATIHILKNREGVLGEIDCSFNSRTLEFESSIVRVP